MAENFNTGNPFLDARTSAFVQGTEAVSGKPNGLLVGTKDFTELPLPGGHVGVYFSSKSQGIVGKTVFDLLIERQ